MGRDAAPADACEPWARSCRLPAESAQRAGRAQSQEPRPGEQRTLVRHLAAAPAADVGPAHAEQRAAINGASTENAVRECFIIDWLRVQSHTCVNYMYCKDQGARAKAFITIVVRGIVGQITYRRRAPGQ